MEIAGGGILIGHQVAYDQGGVDQPAGDHRRLVRKAWDATALRMAANRCKIQPQFINQPVARGDLERPAYTAG